jgi:hypothetical protein
MMMPIRIILVIILFCCLNIPKAISQANLNYCLSKYQVDFEMLMAKRGLDYKSGVVDTRMVGKAAREYTPLLFYYHHGDTLYSWLIFSENKIISEFTLVTQEDLLLKEIQIKNELGIYATLANRGAEVVKNKDSASISVNDELIEILFPGEIKKYLPEIDFLTITPVLNIGTIPYYILKPFNNDSFLVDYLCLNYTKSIDYFVKSSYFNQINFLQQGYYELEFNPLNPLILGNPIAGAGCVQQFSVLPGAEEEALNVAEIMNAEAFIGKDASRKIIENNISNTDFIYFATHGISNAENPMDESYLVIASDSSENCDFLTARQIQDLPLDEDIVVLSACQTALGMSHKAGTIGVSRAFLNAGAQNVIMSLWNIDDASTVEFMEIFIQELQKPTQFFPSQNLRNAILICKQNNLNPVHWGAFVSFGAPYHPDISVKLLIEK